METARYKLLSDSSSWLSELGAQPSDVETLKSAMIRVADEGLGALRERELADSSAKDNVLECRQVATAMSCDVKVINGDVWCQRLCSASGAETVKSVDVIAPVEDVGGDWALLVEGKMGTTSCRSPKIVDLEEKYTGTCAMLSRCHSRIIPVLYVIVSNNVLSYFRYRISRKMKGTHDVNMTACCLREFLEIVGIMPHDHLMSLSSH